MDNFKGEKFLKLTILKIEPGHIPGQNLSTYPDKTMVQNAVKDLRREEKAMTEDEMVGWHHRLNGHEFGWTPGVGDGQGGLACYNPWGHKQSDTTEWLNWTDDSKRYIHLYVHSSNIYNSQDMCYVCKSLQSCPTLCNPMDCSPPGSCVHEILWQEYQSGLPFPPPGDLPNPGIKPASFTFPALASRFFTSNARWEARTWGQPKYLSTDEWIDKMWYMYTMTQPKKEWNNAVCSNTDTTRDYHTK